MIEKMLKLIQHDNFVFSWDNHLRLVLTKTPIYGMIFACLFIKIISPARIRMYKILAEKVLDKIKKINKSALGISLAVLAEIIFFFGSMFSVGKNYHGFDTLFTKNKKQIAVKKTKTQAVLAARPTTYKLSPTPAKPVQNKVANSTQLSQILSPSPIPSPTKPVANSSASNSKNSASISPTPGQNNSDNTPDNTNLLAHTVNNLLPDVIKQSTSALPTLNISQKGLGL